MSKLDDGSSNDKTSIATGLNELSERNLVLVHVGGEVSILEEDIADLMMIKGQQACLIAYARTILTSHSVAPPI